jgi:hypothetical protein
MKKAVLYISIAALLVLTACTGILETAPYNQLASGSMWKSESLCDQGVMGIYYSLRFPVYNGEITGEGINIGYYGWEVFGSTGQSRLGVGGVFASSVTPSNGQFSFVWKWCYDGIHRANDAIANLPAAPIDESKKARLLAESKILRAFFYTRLNELFGNGGIGVPLYTEPVSSDECTKKQSSEAEVWAQIILDLTDAINTASLPDNDIGKEGRVAKGTAYAMRGRAYLLSKDYTSASADFARVGQCGYGLYPNYRELFRSANDGNQEMIFYVQNIENPAGFGSRLQKFCAPWSCGSADSRGCWTDLQVTPYVVDLYEVLVDDNTVKPFNWDDFIPNWSSLSLEDRQVFFIRDAKADGKEILGTVTTAIITQVSKVSAANRTLYLEEGNEERIKAAYANRDPRLNLNVIVPYSIMKGVSSNSTATADYISRWPVSGKYYFDQAASETAQTGIPTSLSANGNAYFYYMWRKFVGEGNEYKLRQDNPCDEPIIRYADVLLMWAEALVEQNQLAEAKDKVKQVRDRVNIPTMDKYFADQTTARNYVRDERRRELALEGVNFFDEMRWHTLKDTKFEYGPKTSMQVWGGIATGSPVYGWVDYWYTWPVPKAEVELNPELVRTPGWSYN